MSSKCHRPFYQRMRCEPCVSILFDISPRCGHVLCFLCFSSAIAIALIYTRWRSLSHCGYHVVRLVFDILASMRDDACLTLLPSGLFTESHSIRNTIETEIETNINWYAFFCLTLIFEHTH